MFLKTHMRQWLLLGSLSIAFAACGGGSKSGDPENPPCDEATCNANGQTCDYINNVCVDCLDTPDCGSGKVCDRATHTCVEGECTVDTECSSGQHCVDNHCVSGIDCDSENLCPNHGICGTDGKCMTTSSVDCADLGEGELPTNAVQVDAKVEISWSPTSGWTTPDKCGWKCAEGYTQHGNECLEDEGCATAADCTDADCVNGACVASQTVNCAEATNVPENATANAQSEVTINFVNGAWEAVPSCGWTCDEGYTLNETQDACEAVTTAPVCGNGILEAGEACDTGANVEPATPAFPEGATCTSEKNDGKSYSGELACASDCAAIETTNCSEVVTGVETVTCRTSPSASTLGMGDTVLVTINIKVVDAENNVLTNGESAAALFTSPTLYYRAQGTTEWLNASDFGTSIYGAATPENTDADSYAYSYALTEEALLADGAYDAIWGITYNGTEYFCPAGEAQVAAITDRDAEGVLYGVLTVNSAFCDNSEECGDGMSCEEGACVGGTTPSICLENECRTPEIGGSEGNEICQGGVWTSGDCAEGSVCTAIPDASPAMGECVTVTPPAPECTEDSDCAEGETCVEGACVETTPEPECTADGDCESGLCVEGACAKQKTVNCAEPTDVPANATANAAFEVTINFVEGAWATAESCGWTCNNGFTINEAKDACVEQEVIPVFFSEYIESGHDKAIEVYNAGESAVTCKVMRYSNGGTSASSTSAAFTLDPQTTKVFCYFGGSSTTSDENKAKCTPGNADVANFNGDDALELVCGEGEGTVTDIFGTIGERPNSAWKTDDSAIATEDMTLRRKCSVTVGVTTNAAGFPSLGTEWDALAEIIFDDLGSHCGQPPADQCTADDDCGEGEVCTDGECVAGEEPNIVCEEGCGTGDHEGQLCIVDDMNPNGVWTICDNGCADGACIVNAEDSCVGKDEYYCMEQNENTLFCNETTGQCVECLDNSEEYGCAEGYECNTATNTCQALCGNGVLNEGEECDPNADKSSWEFATCSDISDTATGDLTCTEACTINYEACVEETPATTSIIWCRLQWPNEITLNATTTSATVYGRIYNPDSLELSPKLIYGSDLADIANWTAIDSTVNGQCTDCGNNTEYQATITAEMYAAMAAGTYKFTYKFTENGNDWYCVDADDVPKSAAEMATETRVGSMTVEKASVTPTWDYTEDFETFSWSTSYDEHETVSNGITWSTVAGSIQTSNDNFKLNGSKSITIRGKNNAAGALTFSGLTNGVGKLRFSYKAYNAVAFTVSCGDYSWSSGALSQDQATIHTFEQNVNSAATSCTIAIDNATQSSGDRRLVIDDVAWTSYQAQ